MSIDYRQLRAMVREAMFTGGGINEPSAPEGIPHRMPASDTADKEQDMGDPQANELYDMAVAAREATEKLIVALDEPIYDGAYEYAFKASACLRKALNSLEESGAHPMPTDRVVAPPANMQKYSGSIPYGFGGGSIGIGDGGGLEEQAQGDAAKVMDVIKGKGGSSLETALRSINEPGELGELLIGFAALVQANDSVNDSLMKAITTRVAKYYQDGGKDER